VSTSVLIAILTSSTVIGGIVSLIQFFVIRHYNQKDNNHKTLSVLAYDLLATKLERCLDKGYATPEQRRDVKVIYDAYHSNGWNGDMDSRMKKFYDLPIKHLDDVYKGNNE